MHIQVDTRGCVLFTLDICRLLSLEESGMCTDTQSHLLRLLIPALKLYTAKKVCTASSHIKIVLLLCVCIIVRELSNKSTIFGTQVLYEYAYQY